MATMSKLQETTSAATVAPAFCHLRLALWPTACRQL